MIWVTVLLFAAFYTVIVLRFVKRRMHPRYLRRTSLHSALWLTLFFVPALLLALQPPGHITMWLAWVQLGVAVVLSGNAWYVIRSMRAHDPGHHYADAELPTVTLAIPARNETRDLEHCLQSVLANDYPKLEIVVLDDCSQAPTADVIKSFAQKGVRFIPGRPPAKRWLAKNQAYQALYEHASGDIIVFAGVDVRFGPRAIRQLVYQLLGQDKRMVSVLPLRRHTTISDGVVQPMRYWWEIAFPRVLFGRPAVLGTCWAISKRDMHRLGGFRGVSRHVIPEQYFARELNKGGGYSFLRSSPDLDITTAKSASEQRRTALRLRYPQLRKRPELVLLLVCFYLLMLLAPFLWWIYALLTGSNWVLPLISSGLLLATHIQILRISDPGNTMLSALMVPVAVVVDSCLVLLSMIRYEFFTVLWKDRNICIPVMHVYPSLPKLDEKQHGGESRHATSS